MILLIIIIMTIFTIITIIIIIMISNDNDCGLRYCQNIMILGIISGIVKTWRTPDWLLQGWARTASSFLVVRFLIVIIIIIIVIKE